MFDLLNDGLITNAAQKIGHRRMIYRIYNAGGAAKNEFYYQLFS